MPRLGARALSLNNKYSEIFKVFTKVVEFLLK